MHIYSQVRGSWEQYAAAHGLDIIVVEYSFTKGKHPYWDRWFCFEHPETQGYDQLLLMDNDVWIRPGAGNPFDTWSGEFISSAQESRQGNWNFPFRPYYESYEVVVPPEIGHLEVHNFGVTLMGRQHQPLARELFEHWTCTTHERAKNSSDPKRRSFFVRETDGPFMSYQLQARNLVEVLPAKYNYLFWAWYVKGHRLPEKLFLLQTKLAQMSCGKLPAPLWKLLFKHPRSLVRQYIQDGDFLHFAASKSPLFLVNRP